MIINLNKIRLLLLALASTMGAWADAPQGYYSSCEGKSGQALLKALEEKISSHTNVGYNGLWDVYEKSDVRSNGTLWDIYSTKQWTSNFTRCGNYKNVGDCVNREHSLPKSWWGGGKADQYSDAFHLYPTDGKVNGQRSNFPFGECASGTSLPANGNVKPLGKLGTCTFSGFTGEVFEPDDEYKGDLARSYFYMATCYNSLIAGWTKDKGNQFFAGNSYPAFKTWAKELLLKWARQDQVSQKEVDRNEAIYTFQHNRNPFIDHPELVEYIWGDKVGQAWYPGGTKEPSFVHPVQNAVINLGQAAVGIPHSTAVAVKGLNLESNVTLSATGSFSVSPTSLTAAQANAGTQVTVTVNARSEGDAEGTLTLRSGSLTRTVDLTAQISDGLPASITDVTSESFTLRWINLHTSTPEATYTVAVAQNGQALDGYPLNVKASAEQLTVTGLEPSTTYTVSFSNLPGGIDSPVLTVTTADPLPYILLLFDGELHFEALPGEASETAELLVEAENIGGEITVEVEAPFQVSTDKSSWHTSTTLALDEDRFYMRTAPTVAGKYETTITLTAANYVNDEASATATIVDRSSFLEDWEQVDKPTETVKCYSSTTFQGTACRWSVDNGGFGTGTQDTDFNGTVALRMGTDNTSSIAMADDKTTGVGTVAFQASKWPNEREADAIVDLQYSADGGMTWETIETFTFSETTAGSFSATVDRPGNGRIRMQQTSGKRWFIDNISITDCTELGAVATLDYHTWDAFCRDSQLILQCRDSSRTLSVYSIDGATLFNSPVADHEQTLTLPKGLYIVTDGSFARRVLVK